MPVEEQGLIESERDIMKLDIIDWNRLNGSWANSFDALQTIASWFVQKAYFTVVKHDLRFAPNIDWPGWKHAGSHEYLGHLYWNDFYYRQRGNLVFSDEPGFFGVILERRCIDEAPLSILERVPRGHHAYKRRSGCTYRFQQFVFVKYRKIHKYYIFMDDSKDEGGGT
jgi:hypothetical protein